MSTRLLWAVIILTGCASGTAGDDGYIETDSAGVRIIASTAPAWGDSARWRVVEPPEVEIGAVDSEAPEYLFSGAHSAMQLTDGRIALGDMGSAELRYYDRQGRFLMRRGRQGQGPGEWSQLYSMRRGGGDSIQVIAPTSTHSIISPSGEYVRRFSLEPVRNRPNMWALGRLASGRMLAYSLAPAGDRVIVPREAARGEEATLGRDTTTRPDGFYREEYMHFLYTGDGRFIDSVGILPGRGQYGGTEQGALLPQSYYAVVGDSLFFGPGHIPEIRVYELWTASPTSDSLDEAPAESRRRAGMTLRRIVRLASPDSAPVSPAIIEAYKARRREVLKGAFRDTPGFNVERSIEMTRFPERLPAHGRIVIDATRAIWMQDYSLPGAEDSPTHWTIFDQRGRWLGRLALPARFRVTDIGADFVLGMWRNDEDVQFVRRYHLDRGRER